MSERGDVDLEALERELDAFDPAVRRRALEGLIDASGDGPEPELKVNMHAHTFFSYNPYGYSPSHLAWLGRRRGLVAVGKVEFDVLDGLDEFVDAGRRLGLRTCVSVESRVFVPEFADRVINSPGEPGIAYHMGVGFTGLPTDPDASGFLAGMRSGAETRNRGLVERVNAFTEPVTLDYDLDVLPRTPNGNATERHICHAYALKAAEQFPDPDELAAFWSGKLGVEAGDLDLPDGPSLQGRIRARTMKRGGVGYVEPGPDAFPLMADMDRFSLACGAIPTLTWLDGTSDGEACIDELMDVAAAGGVAAINIIPDRNFTAGVRDQKLENLYQVVEKAGARGWPVIVGTEMNSPGNKFVDDFDSEALKPLVPAFLEGAFIAVGHSALQRAGGWGYLSDWAADTFASVREKNAFFAEVGRRVDPATEWHGNDLPESPAPDDLLTRLPQGA